MVLSGNEHDNLRAIYKMAKGAWWRAKKETLRTALATNQPSIEVVRSNLATFKKNEIGTLARYLNVGLEVFLAPKDADKFDILVHRYEEVRRDRNV